MNKSIFLALSLCIALGCTPATEEIPHLDAVDAKMKAVDASLNNTTEAKSNSPATAEPTAKASEADIATQAAIIDSMFGKTELREWKNLSGDSIGKKLTTDLVKTILRVDHPVTAKKDPGFPEWTYSWSSPDKKESGSVKISIPLDNQAANSMKIQAGVRQQMAEQGQGTQIDLSRYGVVGVYRTKRGANDLQICTADKIVIVNTKNMRGRGFKDVDKMRTVAAELATALFESHK